MISKISLTERELKMRKVTFRSEETKRELVKKFNDLVQSGYTKGAAAKELDVTYSLLIDWGRKYADELHTVTVQTRKPYTKRDTSQKAVIIVTTLSNVSEVLKSL